VGGAAPAPGSGKRKAELKEDDGFGLQAAVLPELAGSGGVAGGDDPERVAGDEVAQQAAAAWERRRRPAGSAGSRGRRDLAESRRRRRLGLSDGAAALREGEGDGDSNMEGVARRWPYIGYINRGSYLPPPALVNINRSGCLTSDRLG